MNENQSIHSFVPSRLCKLLELTKGGAIVHQRELRWCDHQISGILKSKIHWVWRFHSHSEGCHSHRAWCQFIRSGPAEHHTLHGCQNLCLQNCFKWSTQTHWKEAQDKTNSQTQDLAFRSYRCLGVQTFSNSGVQSQATWTPEFLNFWTPEHLERLQASTRMWPEGGLRESVKWLTIPGIKEYACSNFERVVSLRIGQMHSTTSVWFSTHIYNAIKSSECNCCLWRINEIDLSFLPLTLTQIRQNIFGKQRAIINGIIWMANTNEISVVSFYSHSPQVWHLKTHHYMLLMRPLRTEWELVVVLYSTVD